MFTCVFNHDLSINFIAFKGVNKQFLKPLLSVNLRSVIGRCFPFDVGWRSLVLSYLSEHVYSQVKDFFSQALSLIFCTDC